MTSIVNNTNGLNVSDGNYTYVVFRPANATVPNFNFSRSINETFNNTQTLINSSNFSNGSFYFTDSINLTGTNLSNINFLSANNSTAQRH